MLNQNKQKSSQTNPAFLLSSSHLFNQKRLQIAKAREIAQSERKHRMFDGLKQDFSNDIDTDKKQHKNNGDDKQNGSIKKIGDVLKQEQDVIVKLIGELGYLKNQLARCEKSYKKMGQTDLSKEDEVFIMNLLHHHNYITKQQSKQKISDVFQILKQKHNEKHQKLQHTKPKNQLNQLSESKPDPESSSSLSQADLFIPTPQHGHDSYLDKDHESLPILQNLRQSRTPLASQLCSIAHQVNKNDKNDTASCLSLQKRQKIQNKCSLQLDLIKESSFQVIDEKDVKDKQINMNARDKASKRYELQEEGEEAQEIRWGFGNKSKQEMIYADDSKQSGSQEGLDNLKLMVPEPYPEYTPDQLQKMLQKINLKNPTDQLISQNTPPRCYPKQPLTSRYHNDQQKVPNCLGVVKIGHNMFIGSLSNINCEIYYDSIQNITIKGRVLWLKISCIGTLAVKASQVATKELITKISLWA